MSVGERQHVTISGEVFRLKRSSAYDWIMAYSREPKSLSWIIPGMIQGDVDRIFDQYMNLPDVERRWLNTARVALERESGRTWWRAANLIDKVLEAWTVVHGSLLLQGCDPSRMPLSAWLDAAYVDIMRRAGEDDVKRLELELNKTPVGVFSKSINSENRRALNAFAAD